MSITKNKRGNKMLIKGKENINNYRLIVLKQGLRLEMLGMKHSSGKSCYAIIKDEFKLIGSRENVYNQYVEILELKHSIRTNKRSN